MRTLSSAVLLLMIPVLSAWATEEVEPLDVYFFARTVGEPLSNSEKKLLEIEIWRKKLEADQAQKDLDERLKSQYGKDRDDWPGEQQEAYRLAIEAQMMAQLEIDFLERGAFAKGKQEDLDDSVEDIMKAIQGKGIFAIKQKWITLVENRDQAHLLVEILDRGPFLSRFPPDWSPSPQLKVQTVLAVRISPVEALRSNRLDDIGPKEAKWIKVHHAFRYEEPYWILESGANSHWGNAAGALAYTLNMFIKDNRAVLKGEAPIQ